MRRSSASRRGAARPGNAGVRLRRPAALPEAPGGGGGGPDYSAVQRNLALELVRVTEAGALAAAKTLGKGDKDAADAAAVDAMRRVLHAVAFDGHVVVGEGEKDNAPMLYRGERVGDGSGPPVDLAVDPLDGTSLVASGRNGAVALIAVANEGALYDPGSAYYMQKIAVGPEAAGAIDIEASPATNLRAVAGCLSKPVEELGVAILDRPRHADLVAAVRAVGARIHLVRDGDVAEAIAAAYPGTDIDVLMGVGGTPEGVLAACALRCLGGELQGRLWPRDDEDRDRLLAEGRNPGVVLTMDDLCGRGEQDICFAATGVSDGDLLRGVRFVRGGAVTNSLVLRSRSRTTRELSTTHRWGARPSLTQPHFATRIVDASP